MEKYSANIARRCEENNKLEIIKYRSKNVAGFTVDGQLLLCLPQAFRIFLKDLVGGLHTVYTKLRRLDILPIVCNVEQVRILRGIGAISSGVNRCKLLSPDNFDILLDDCTNSCTRPGRPAKRCNNSTLSFILPSKIQRSNSNPAIFSDYHEPNRLNPSACPNKSIMHDQLTDYPPIFQTFLIERSSETSHSFCKNVDNIFNHTVLKNREIGSEFRIDNLLRNQHVRECSVNEDLSDYNSTVNGFNNDDFTNKILVLKNETNERLSRLKSKLNGLKRKLVMERRQRIKLYRKIQSKINEVSHSSQKSSSN
ncbi:hypothetical protein GJ496_011222 [Pomphorhynchus laevis]|nr:hypothetical protein GJ496_011222 [Pomphorhynchus laevis]